MELASHSASATVKVLRAKMNRTSSPKLRKVIITRIFAEYVASFELLAALCLALRDRLTVDILQTLSTYSPEEIRRFYRRVSAKPAGFDFMTFTRMPSLDGVRRVTRDPEILQAYEYSSRALSRRVRAVADQLGKLGFSPIHVHNKIKHSNVFVDDAELLKQYYGYGQNWDVPDDESHVCVVPKIRTTSEGRRQMTQPPVVLNATRDFADKLVSNTHQLCKSCKEIAALAFMMDHLGLLWRDATA